MKINRLSFGKIFFHIDHLHRFLTTGDTYPVHITIGLTDYCNHNCVWCYSAYSTHVGYIVDDGGTLVEVDKRKKDLVIDKDVLLDFLRQAKEKGLKAVSVVGSGEPLLHPQSTAILEEIGKMGVDFGIYSNGSKISDRQIKVITNYGTFFRFSVDAAEWKTYAKLHRGVANLDETFNNIRRLLGARRKKGKRLPTIGAQYLVSQLNDGEILKFAELMRDIGVDYVAYKPMMSNPINIDRVQNKLRFKDVLPKLEKVQKYETEAFKVYSKIEQFRDCLAGRQYNGTVYYSQCLGHAFSPSLYANGNLYLCVNMEGRKEFILGNIYQSTFKEIWHSEQRKQAIKKIDLHHKCPAACRMDPLNKILWEVIHPDPETHPNFL